MWKINKHGRTYKNGDSLSSDYRMSIIDNKIQRRGNRFTGEVLYGSFTSVASSLNISKQTVTNVWKRFVEDETVVRRPSAEGRQSHLTDGGLELIEIVKKVQPSTMNIELVYMPTYSPGFSPAV